MLAPTYKTAEELRLPRSIHQGLIDFVSEPPIEGFDMKRSNHCLFGYLGRKVDVSSHDLYARLTSHDIGSFFGFCALNQERTQEYVAFYLSTGELPEYGEPELPTTAF